MNDYDAQPNTCPSPTAHQFAILVEQTRDLIKEVVEANPSFTREQSISWAIDGMGEGWELDAATDRALRDYFA